MNNYYVTASLGFLFCIVAPSVSAELPSLATDRAPHAQEQAAWFGELQRWRRGRVGAVDYRFASNGVETKFRFLGANTRAQIGFDGEHRVEAAWRTHGGDLRVALKAERADSGLRIEFVRQF